MLTVDDIAQKLSVSVWTARRYASAWSELQDDNRIPRVSLLRTGRRGRPRYGVDAASFARWLCPAAQAA